MKKPKIPKEVEINGIMFENINPYTKKGLDIVADIEKHDLLDLFDIYNSPSTMKIDIYEDWKKWFLGIDTCITNFGCLRGSSHTFSIGAFFVYNECAHWCYITKCHNRVVRVSTHLLWQFDQTLIFEKGVKL